MFRGKSGFQYMTLPGGRTGQKMSGTSYYRTIANAKGKPIVFSGMTVRTVDSETHATTYYRITGGVVTFQNVNVDGSNRFYGRVAINAVDDLSIQVDTDGITYSVTHPTKDLESDFEGLEERVTALEKA